MPRRDLCPGASTAPCVNVLIDVRARLRISWNSEPMVHMLARDAGLLSVLLSVPLADLRLASPSHCNSFTIRRDQGSPRRRRSLPAGFCDGVRRRLQPVRPFLRRMRGLPGALRTFRPHIDCLAFDPLGLPSHFPLSPPHSRSRLRFHPSRISKAAEPAKSSTDRDSRTFACCELLSAQNSAESFIKRQVMSFSE